MPDRAQTGDGAWVEKFALLSNERGKIIPYQYQIDVAKRIKDIVEGAPRQHGVIVLKLPTGSGKSIAGYAAALVNGYRSVFMYPTKELVREQYEKFMKYRVNGKKPDAVPAKINADEISALLAKHRADLPPEARKRITNAAEISDIYSDSRAIFTTIDSFYYASSFAYGRSKNVSKHDRHRQLTSDAALVNVKTMIPDVYFIDEFDSYDVKQKASVEWMICMLCHPVLQEIEGRNKCVIIASATPDDDMLERLRATGIAVHVDIDEARVEPGKETMQILPDVDVVIHGTRDFRGITHLHEILDRVSPSMVKECIDDGKKIVFIADSVKDCKDIASILASAGIPRDAIGEIHGLGAITDADRKIAREKPIVIGNRTIDLGIDFDADVLFMTAPTPQLFEQRLGRLRGNRKRDCTCYMLLPHRVAIALNEKFGESPVDRRDLREFLHAGDGGKPIYDWYNKYDSFRSGYAPIEFLNVLDDRAGGIVGDPYSPMTVPDDRVQEMLDAARSIFPALYRRDFDSVVAQRNAIRLQFKGKWDGWNKRDFIDWLFMSFRDQSLVTCTVHDLSDGSWHDYNAETILRHGIIISDKCYINKNGVPIITVNGYKPPGDKGNELYYTAPPSFSKTYLVPNGFTEIYTVAMPTTRDEGEKHIDLQGTKFPFVVDVISGIRLESDDPAIQNVITTVIMPAMKVMASGDERHRYQLAFIAVMDAQKNPERTMSSLAFKVEAKLRLPMHDKTSPFTITINVAGRGPRRYHGVIGTGVYAMLLEGALKERDWFMKRLSSQ